MSKENKKQTEKQQQTKTLRQGWTLFSSSRRGSVQERNGTLGFKTLN